MKRVPKVPVSLAVEPELRSRAKKLGESECRIRRDAALPVDDDNELAPDAWGFRDTSFRLLPNGSVTLTGNRYALSGLELGRITAADVPPDGVATVAGPVVVLRLDDGVRGYR